MILLNTIDLAHGQRWVRAPWLAKNGTPIQPPDIDVNTMQDLWAINRDDAVAVLAFGKIIRGDRNDWRLLQSPTNNHLYSIWGADRMNLFAVGASGTLLQFDGRTWKSRTSPTTHDLISVWGRAADDVFAVGKAGTIVHFDGTRWSPQPSSTDRLVDVWGTGHNMFVVGERGTILHHDGKRWAREESGTDQRLYALWGTGPFDVYAIGDYGTILHRRERGAPLHADRRRRAQRLSSERSEPTADSERQERDPLAEL